MVGVSIEKPPIMVSRGFGRFRMAMAKKDKVSTTSTPLCHPNALINPTISRTTTLVDGSSAVDPVPASKMSGLDRALRLIQPRTSRPPKTTLKIAPSGAIVFSPAQSQESLVSSVLPGEASLLYVHRRRKADDQTQ